MGAPDATKVRVHGPGIEHGVLATFQSRFLCDTRGAGAGQLTVRVRGPKGMKLARFCRNSLSTAQNYTIIRYTSRNHHFWRFIRCVPSRNAEGKSEGSLNSLQI